LTLPTFGPSAIICHTSITDRVVVGERSLPQLQVCLPPPPQDPIHSSRNKVKSACEKPLYTVSRLNGLSCKFVHTPYCYWISLDNNDQTPCCTFHPYSRVQYGHDLFLLEWTVPIFVTFSSHDKRTLLLKEIGQGLQNRP
jgi:hypothetical protein